MPWVLSQPDKVYCTLRSRVSTVETHHCYPHIWLLVLHRHVITFNCCHSSHDRKSSWHCLSVWGENKSECHRDGITKCTPKDRVEGAEQPWECRIGKLMEASIELGLLPVLAATCIHMVWSCLHEAPPTWLAVSSFSHMNWTGNKSET